MSTTKTILGPPVTGEVGPLYGAQLIESLPLGQGGFRQAMPDRADLDTCRKKMKLDRVVAAYEVLLSQFRQLNHACLVYLATPDMSDAETDAIRQIRNAVVR